MKDKLRIDLDFTPPALRQVTTEITKVDGINLGQGTCLLEVPPIVKAAARDAITRGDNRYGPAIGTDDLRETLTQRLQQRNQIPCHKDHVMITTGSTGAFESICSTFLTPGDEVVLFTPFYPYHRNPLAHKGVNIKQVKLAAPDWSIDFDELASAISEKTKFILLCTPNNPTGKVFSREELEAIGKLCVEHNIFCVTDEVYEYITYDGKEHGSLASLPGMFERTITMGSYSKTFAITGWRIGYLVAPETVMIFPPFSVHLRLPVYGTHSE